MPGADDWVRLSKKLFFRYSLTRGEDSGRQASVVPMMDAKTGSSHQST